jgi:hypothetical protein
MKKNLKVLEPSAGIRRDFGCYYNLTTAETIKIPVFLNIQERPEALDILNSKHYMQRPASKMHYA